MQIVGFLIRWLIFKFFKHKKFAISKCRCRYIIEKMNACVFILAVLTVSFKIVDTRGVIHRFQFDMIKVNPNAGGASISCIGQTGKFVHVVNASGIRQAGNGKPHGQTFALTKSELFNLESACSCTETCDISQVEERKPNKWTMNIEYKCLDTCYICEEHNASISCANVSGSKMDMLITVALLKTYVCTHTSLPIQ